LEVASIGVELDEGLLHLEYSMKLSEKGNQVINAIWSKSSKCSVAHTQKEKAA
jgi:hypothetical protein